MLNYSISQVKLLMIYLITYKYDSVLACYVRVLLSTFIRVLARYVCVLVSTFIRVLASLGEYSLATGEYSLRIDAKYVVLSPLVDQTLIPPQC